MQRAAGFRRHSNDRLARMVVFLSPYIFWAVISTVCASLWLFLS
jgi:hypothetical protein